MIFGLFDQLFPLMFTVIFLIVIGTFIYTAVTGLTTWHKNNQSPRLTVPAKVVAKRQNTTHHSRQRAMLPALTGSIAQRALLTMSHSRLRAATAWSSLCEVRTTVCSWKAIREG